MYTCTPAHLHAYTAFYIYVCVYGHIFIYRERYTYIYIYVYQDDCVSTCIHIYTCIYIHMYISVYTDLYYLYIYIYMYIYMFALDRFHPRSAAGRALPAAPPDGPQRPGDLRRPFPGGLGTETKGSKYPRGYRYRCRYIYIYM